MAIRGRWSRSFARLAARATRWGRTSRWFGQASTLRLPALESLRSRISYAQPLVPFSLEDTRDYVVFHVKRAGARRPVQRRGVMAVVASAFGDQELFFRHPPVG